MKNIFGKFSPNLQKILITAERIAKEQNSIIDTEHLFLAILMIKGTLANDILSIYKISEGQAQLVAGLISKSISKNAPSGMSKDAKAATQLAVQFASKYKHQTVDTEHLLLGLISNKTFNSYDIVERIGISPKDIKIQIESVFLEIDKSKNNTQMPNIDHMDFAPGEIPSGPMGIPQGMSMQATKTKPISALESFTTNITNQARNNTLDPVVGRNNEIDRITQILSRRKKNSPILVGEPGVGKTAIVEGLAQRMVEGEVPTKIINKEILSLDMGSLLAGTMYRGQFESRIKKIISEIKKKGNILLFIDEIHTVIGTGSAEGSMDAANILKPPLARGEIQVIGATTFDEFKKHIEKDAAFERRFQPVIVNETDETETLQILKGIKKKYEDHHKVKYLPNALEAAVKLSHRYIQDRFLPDKAIDLIDEAAAATNVVSPQARELSKILRTLTKISSEKDESVSNEKYEKASRLRQEELKLKERISKIEKKCNKDKKNTISDDDIANVVSKWSGIPVTNLTLSEKKMFMDLEKRITKHIIGQSDAVSEIAKAIRRSRVGISDPKRPIGSFIFLGPTGVGKSELVKILAKEMFGRDDSLIKIDMSEFMEKHNVSRLVGAPAGYVGYEEGGKLTEKIRKQPYSLILLDEIEKAHPEVFNILLQIFEDGQLTDAKGRRVDFRNTLIVMTSNLGTDILTKGATIGFSDVANKNNFIGEYDKLKEKVMDTIEKHFKPEFLNRIDKTIIFKPLDQKSIRKIVDLEVNKLIARTKNLKIKISISTKAKNWIAKKGYEPEYGARPMRRVISDNIEVPLSEGILNEKFKKGDKVVFTFKNNQIVLEK